MKNRIIDRLQFSCGLLCHSPWLYRIQRNNKITGKLIDGFAIAASFQHEIIIYVVYIFEAIRLEIVRDTGQETYRLHIEN